MGCGYLRVCAALAIGILTFTRTAAAAGPAQPELAALTQAYADLAVGNHDYKGHRVKAIKQVEAACRLLGMNIKGDGKAHEDQRSSDQRLRDAQALLANVRAMALEANQSGVVEHVDAAIKQIEICLTIK